ncbi:hypothetical protein EHQ94_02140 [Leptospira meyeri]|uniref:hypothetical protein n=1 Tax=Leptospira meyeri TaxID=29508 RepID=UPI0010842C55|nr:hypothetical protein [Leptospira meyeri]TGM65860.1 hypothetical protein EHQ93_08920 [Leptospira meyeri]TGM72072.1 hypothetical protein EHQ94_02140 [Leptospira meyeri]
MNKFKNTLKDILFYHLLWCTIFYVPNIAFLFKGYNYFGNFMLELLQFKDVDVLQNIYSFLFFYFYLTIISLLSLIIRIASKKNTFNNLGAKLILNVFIIPITPFFIFYLIGLSKTLSTILIFISIMPLVYLSPIVILFYLISPILLATIGKYLQIPDNEKEKT